MDELYGNLENYKEVYITEELQNENKQLKLKLEEYETAMGKLQKDYDKLALEFHNLQKNYSSLLKTARAEVERKTQTITQLNITNDMKILESLKSGHNRGSQNNSSKFHKGVQNINKADNLDVSKVENKSKDGLKPKKVESGSEMSENNRESTNISVPVSNRTKIYIVDNVVARVDACISKGVFNENISQSNPKHVGAKNIPGKIIDKRMSVCSDVVPKFSSEDESESGMPTTHEARSDIHSVVSSVINHVNTGGRVSQDSRSTKISDTSSIDAKCYNIQDEPRHSNRNRMSRDYEQYKDKVRETDKTRDSGRSIVRDRYRESDKYKENEKGIANDRYSYRPRYYDKFSARDKHDPHYRYRKHSPDRARKRSYREYQDDHYKLEYERKRPEYDRKKPELPQHDSYHEDDRHKHHNEEKQYNISKTYDRNKRHKTDTQVHFHQDKICVDNEATEYDMLHASCQSPDNQGNTAEMHTETINTHVIKEIKNTAATPLEDPRVASKKYILKSDNGKSVLCTAISQNIDIKPVDQSLWNVQSVAIPDALLCTPMSNTTEDNLKDLLSIDRQQSNESLESGEICCDSEIESNIDVKESIKEKTKDILSKDDSKVASNLKSNEVYVKTIKTGYRIPKLKKSKRNSGNRSLDNPKDDFIHKTQKHVTNNPKQDRNSPQQEKHNLNQDTNILDLNLPLINVPEDVIPISESKKSCGNKSSEQQSKIMYSMAMVQDDLELSDENSDYTDKMVINEKTGDIRQHVDTILDNTSANTNPHVKVISDETGTSTEIINKQGDNKTKDYNGHKKHKSKRKKTKSIEIELSENTKTEKKKPKKDKDFKSKEIKCTFSDLFGDSSSLITPEDLGIPASCMPLCDDGQDAMDINIKDIMKLPLPGTEIVKGSCAGQVSEKTHDIDVNNLNIKDKVIAKIEEKAVYSHSPPQTIVAYPQLHQNFDKPDVVKTVIISSGVQPQLELLQGTSEKRVAGVEVDIQKIASSNEMIGIKDIKKVTSKALATSTPYKEVSTHSETSSVTEDCLNDSNYSNSESKDGIAKSSASQLVTNAQSTYDPPDVRIFVKRRRKGVKRT